MLKIFVSKKSPRWRCLRSYCRIADKSYDCCNCPQWIEPGMPYHGEVWVCGKNLLVKRCHDGCPEDPDEELRKREAEDDEREHVGEVEVAAKQAA